MRSLPVSATPDWKLRAFHWLPLARWTPDNLFGPVNMTGGYCKVCDSTVDKGDFDGHVAKHVKEEQARHERELEANRIANAARREEEAREKAMLAGKEYKPRTNNNSGNFSGKVSDYVSAMEEALKASSGLTLAQLSDETGVNIGAVRNHHRKVKGITIIGTVPASGGRGKPANIYGLEA